MIVGLRLITLLIAGIGCTFFNIAYAQNSAATKNVVLVHGAFVDGSGWRDIYQSLTQKGYKVSVTQHKLQDFDEDVAEVNRIIDQQDGPCVLVGHSYGGVVITQAGHNPKVSALVYIAAHAPDDGELRADLIKTFPPASTSIIKASDGLDYIDPQKFPADFAADLPVDQARFMADSWPIRKCLPPTRFFAPLFTMPHGRPNRVGIWSQNRTG